MKSKSSAKTVVLFEYLSDVWMKIAKKRVSLTAVQPEGMPLGCRLKAKGEPDARIKGNKWLKDLKAAKIPIAVKGTMPLQQFLAILRDGKAKA